jgi:hypothetical protein
MSAAADVLDQYSAAAVAVEFLFTIESVQRNNEDLQVTKGLFVRIVRQSGNNVRRITIRRVGICMTWMSGERPHCAQMKNIIRYKPASENRQELHALDVKLPHWLRRVVQSSADFYARTRILGRTSTTLLTGKGSCQGQSGSKSLSSQ